MVSACQAAEVSVILTSRSFIEKGRLQEAEKALGENARLIYLEDVRAEITFGDKLRGLLGAKKARVQRQPNDPAAILFTSGSEGTPKGVVLSHRNMLANAIQSLTRVAAHGDDKVFNVLPVFHSFGLTAGLIMPLDGRHPDLSLSLAATLPDRARACLSDQCDDPVWHRHVPQWLCPRRTPIRLSLGASHPGRCRSGQEAYARCLHGTLWRAHSRRLWRHRNAPVLAINTPLANKSGTVGRLSPLMEARLDDVPGIEEGGRLFVRGPNVMLGYLRAENPGVLEPLADGWHDTGDIVTIDTHGYITIRGRAKRFAKIAGEMVSLSAVEALAAELNPAILSVVVSIPDLRKGERLVLLTTDKEITRARFQQLAKAKGAADLMVPAEVMIVDSVPVLGSGKTDYVGALELVTAKAAAKRVA